MAKRHRAAGGMGSSRRNGRVKGIGKACVQALEGRVLLAVAAGEYDAIRSTYPGFNLPADMASISIVEITPDQLSVANLKSAITTAGATTLPDLVVLRTTDTQNTITYASSSDTVSINIPSSQGAISVVGFGSRPLTIDAANQSRVISIGGASSTTTVNLGGLTLTRGYMDSGHGAGVYQDHGTLNLTSVMISGNSTPGFYGGGVYQSYGTLSLTNVMISGSMAASGSGVYQSYGTSTLMNVTISGNMARSNGGGVYLNSGACTLRNTIVARNAARTSPDIDVTGSGALSGLNNLIGDGSGQSSLVNGSSGNLVGSSASPIDPKLAEGTSFGIGLSPFAGSPAIDAGSDSLIPTGITTDIYGTPRIQGIRVNIGAVETVLPGMPGATYVVTSLADSMAADGVITLREVLAAANSNQAAGDAPAGSYSSGDMIAFAPGLSGIIYTNGQAYQISGSVSITGPGTSQLTLDGGGVSGVLDVRGMYDVSISGMTITGGNTAAGGGGIYASGSHLTLNEMVLSANTGTGGGGAFLSACTSTLTNVTISGNTASECGGGLGQGGGTLNLTNVTISGNTALSSYGYGGGVYQGSGTSTLTNVTISGNRALDGGGMYQLSGTLTLRNTVVAGNVADTAPDMYQSRGSTLSGSNNLIGDGSGQSSLVNGSGGNLVGSSASPIDPMLAEGSGFGIALCLVAGSPAIDAGDSSLIPMGISTDIYGAARIQGVRVNIGAVETVLPGMPGVTYVVTSLADSTAADGIITLREALAAANSNLAVGDAPAGSYSSGDVITFAAGLSGSIYTNGQAYQITGSVSITGPGTGQLTLNGGGTSGVLDIRGMYDVNISEITIEGGNAVEGGGIYGAYSRLTLNQMVISGNTALPSGYGGGLYLYFGTSTLTNVTISGNTASSGGGVYQSHGTSTLTNVTISGNTASGNGGGAYLDSGTSTLTNVTISGNTAAWGGGLYQSHGTSMLTSVTISGNTASGNGGGAYLDSGTSMLTNVTISGNAAVWGGGMYPSYGTLNLTNVTISGNTAFGYGGGLFQWYGTSTLRNTIVARNTAGSGPDVYQSTVGTLSGSNNLIGNGSGETSLINGSNGNLVGSSISPIDPLFVSMSGSNWTMWDLHLQATSPAINAGDNVWVPAGVTTDITGGARVINGTVDMGAYEFDRAPTDLLLPSSSIAEGQPSGSIIGTLSTNDADVGDSFTYSLVAGTGSADNASFATSGNQLLTAASFNFEAKNSYSVRLRSTDQGGLWFEKAFTISVTDVDEIAPTVTAVYVRGSSWNTNYLSFLAANMSGSSATYGYAIPVGSGAAQLQTLPWRNLNRISIAFSEDVSVAQAQFAIVGSVGSYNISGFSYNATDHVATWSLSAVIGADKLYVALPGSGATPVTDTAGNALDGEWMNPTSYSQVGATSSFPSGNGAAGGDFAFRFDVLPGDSTGGSLGKVNVADIAQTKSRSSLPETTSSYRSDIDGNGLINVADIAYVKSRSSISSLPVDPPVLPSFGPVFSQVSLLQRDRSLTLW